MRVIFTDDITDDACRFFIGLVPIVIQHRHGIQDASMYGLETISDIRQRPAHDYAHRIVEVGLAHLLLEVRGQGFLGYLIHRV